jgi:P27 family predicted phage terminase small subunit
VSEYDRLNLLAKTDGPTMEAFCIQVDQMRRSQKFLIKNGETYSYDTESGTRYLKRPEYDVLMKALAGMRMYGVEIGATPASRGKVSSGIQADLFNKDKDSKNAWSGFPN